MSLKIILGIIAICLSIGSIGLVIWAQIENRQAQKLWKEYDLKMKEWKEAQEKEREIEKDCNCLMEQGDNRNDECGKRDNSNANSYYV